jgi:coenzyme PQQ biosynthesis protein PqqD
MIDSDDRPTQRAGVLAQQADDELVLLDVQAGSYFALNEVGARVWELCDGSRSVAEIVGALGVEFDAPHGTIENDVRELLEDLARDELVAW